MADQGPRYRSLTAPGTGAVAAAGLVRATLEDRHGVTVHEVAPGRFSVARTRRPTWALVLCACTFWMGGLGLLFLLVRQTEAGEVVVADGPRGCVITIPPVLDPATVHDLEIALQSGGPDTPGPAPFTPPTPTDDDLDGRTIARGATDDAPPITTAASHAVLRFDTGEVTIGAGTAVVLGRDPSDRGTATARPVPGDATTVSKSHLLVTFDGTAVTVEDLGSTNGSTLVRHGEEHRLEAGVPRNATDGDEIALGAARFVVTVTSDPTSEA